jgi:hypothetical protein
MKLYFLKRGFKYAAPNGAFFVFHVFSQGFALGYKYSAPNGAV